MAEEKYCRQCGAEVVSRGVYLNVCPECGRIQYKDGSSALAGEYEEIYSWRNKKHEDD